MGIHTYMFTYIHLHIHILCTTLYYRVQLCTTEVQNYFVLQSTTLYYRILLLYYRVQLCTTGYNFVMQNTTLYYRVQLCTTEYNFVLQSITFVLQNAVLLCTAEHYYFCTTEHNFVLQITTLHYRVQLCATEHSITLYYRVILLFVLPSAHPGEPPQGGLLYVCIHTHIYILKTICKLRVASPRGLPKAS